MELALERLCRKLAGFRRHITGLKSYKYFNLAYKISLSCNFFIENRFFGRKNMMLYNVSVGKRNQIFPKSVFWSNIENLLRYKSLLMLEKLILGNFSF